MAFRLDYPDDDEKQSKVLTDRQAAIDEAYLEANEVTVEVYETRAGDEDVSLLVRYEKREEPVPIPKTEPEPVEEKQAKPKR